MQAGRPKKYTRPRDLQEAVDQYFDAISRTQPIYLEEQEVQNDRGETMIQRVYFRPPSISGLCLHLGIDKKTWQNYKNRKGFDKVVEGAKAQMEAYLEEQLLTREKSVQGIIFNLQNNYGWKQKQEVEIGENTRQQLAETSLSLKEKLDIMRTAADLYAKAEQEGE